MTLLDAVMRKKIHLPYLSTYDDTDRTCYHAFYLVDKISSLEQVYYWSILKVIPFYWLNKVALNYFALTLSNTIILCRAKHYLSHRDWYENKHWLFVLVGYWLFLQTVASWLVHLWNNTTMTVTYQYNNLHVERDIFLFGPWWWLVLVRTRPDLFIV